MKEYKDNPWKEGKNSKQEEAKRVKSKRRKAQSIQSGIEEYFLNTHNINTNIFKQIDPRDARH